MTNLKRFRQWLKQRMLDIGGFDYNQRNLADELGVRPATISAWFNEPKPPSDESIWSIALWANVEPPDIYAVLDMPVPEDYDQWRFRWDAMYDKLSQEKKVEIWEELTRGQSTESERDQATARSSGGGRSANRENHGS